MAEQEVLLEVRDLCKNFKVRSRKIGESAQLLHALRLCAETGEHQPLIFTQGPGRLPGCRGRSCGLQPQCTK